MNHVHWWLFALSFVTGFGFTFALMFRAVKRQVAVRTSTRAPRVQSVPPTMKGPTAKGPPTTKISAAKEPRTKRLRVMKQSPTTKIHVAKEAPTTKTRGRKEVPTAKTPATEKTTKIPVAEKTTKIPAPDATTKIPAADATTEVPAADATTKVPAADATTRIKVVPYAPYGPGSARADTDGNGPAGWLVKGRSDTRLYYTPDDPIYDQTVAQVWFKNENSAAKALFTPWRKSSRK